MIVFLVLTSVLIIFYYVLQLFWVSSRASTRDITSFLREIGCIR